VVVTGSFKTLDKSNSIPLVVVLVLLATIGAASRVVGLLSALAGTFTSLELELRNLAAGKLGLADSGGSLVDATGGDFCGKTGKSLPLVGIVFTKRLGRS